MSEILIVVLGTFALGIGILGCILPIIPGPPISFVALLLIYISGDIDYDVDNLILFGAAAAIVTVLDYIIPAWGTKKFGGSKKGVWGSTIGLVIGLFFPPIGIILGPFLGAIAGELVDGKDSKSALKSGFGAFLGFLMGVGLKLIVSLAIAWEFYTAIF